MELALLEFLRRDDQALDLSIELLDDVALEGDALELIQTKYQVRPGSLTDSSPDLWKTLRVWSEAESTHPEALLMLVTTSAAPEGSIAALLREGDDRSPQAAHDRLVTQARAISSEALKKATAAFLGLGDESRLNMVNRIVIADEAPEFQELDEAFGRALRHAAPAARRPALIGRLREWWVMRAERHLVEVALGEHPRISGTEIENRIADLRDQLAADNLPNDLEDLAAPSDEEVADDQRMFVMQLRLIALANARIRNAVHDYNRAFEQRARWVREDLVEVGELARYEKRVKEEWDRIWQPETDEPAELSEDELRELGRAIHRSCDDAIVEPIRPRVTAPYIMRGSFQILADEMKIGWHREWVSRMQALLEGAKTD